MSLLLIDRYRSQRRREQQAAIDAGHIQKCDEFVLLEPEQLAPLARFSLLLLFIGAFFFVGLDIAVALWLKRPVFAGLTWWGVVLWLAINIFSYVLVLPIHEAIHGIAFAFWGGKPYFGAKLPLALYCGARNQAFRRDQYLVVGLAPLVVVSIVGIVVTLLSPALGAFIIFATVGNCAGAAGDVWVAWRLWRLPRSIIVEDVETGYRAWEITP